MKRRSPKLALAISLTPNIFGVSFFFLSSVLNYAYPVLIFGHIVPTWVVALCCLFPDGYGQFYNGEYRKGLKFLAWAALSVVGMWLAFAIDVVISGLCIVSRFACGIASTIDAYRSAKRINEQNQTNEGEKSSGS